MFPTLREIYEMILPSRLDNFATHKGFFSDMLFGFQMGVGCTKASFTILETIITCLRAVARFSAAFLMFVKPLIHSVWIDGILYKLLSELGIGSRMWKVMKDLYTNVVFQVLYAGSLSKKIMCRRA